LQERCVTFQFKFSTLSDIAWSILTANIQSKKKKKKKKKKNKINKILKKIKKKIKKKKKK